MEPTADVDESGSLPLSVLVDRHAGPSGARDEDFVRAFAAWLHARRTHLTIDVAERLGLTDVVATFQMRDRVRLVISGYPPDELPGEVTVRVDEREFPHTMLTVHRTPSEAPYEFCTLDFALAGWPVTVEGGRHAGRRGTIVVAATVGEAREVRVRLEDGAVVTVPAASVTPDRPGR